jgi:hypothetical protein
LNSFCTVVKIGKIVKIGSLFKKFKANNKNFLVKKNRRIRMVVSAASVEALARLIGVAISQLQRNGVAARLGFVERRK